MKLIGIDNIKSDALLGAGSGIGLIVLNVVGLFSFALPPVLTLSTNVGKFLVVVVLAPIIEEVLFRGVLINFFSSLKNNYWVSNISQALSFAMFHLVAYSGVVLERFEFAGILIVGGAFISAALFGLLSGLLAKYTNNILPGIIAHAIINLWLVQGLLVIVG